MRHFPKTEPDTTDSMILLRNTNGHLMPFLHVSRADTLSFVQLLDFLMLYFFA